MGARKTLISFANWRLQESLSEYIFYQKKFKRLLMAMFEWKNLPDGISQRYLEDSLYTNGLAIFYKSKKMGTYIVSKATAQGLNIYEEPISFSTLNTGLTEIVEATDCVQIYNDVLRQGNMINVNFFAKRLSNIEKTIDINLEQLKNPYIISCSEGQVETVKSMLKDKSNGNPYILVSEKFDKNVQSSVFDLKIENHIPELQLVKHDYENEGLTFFALDNVNVLKRERLISSEGEQNDQQILVNRNAMYKQRKIACDMINERWDLGIDVDLSANLPDDLEEYFTDSENDIDEMGGDE